MAEKADRQRLIDQAPFASLTFGRPLTTGLRARGGREPAHWRRQEPAFGKVCKRPMTWPNVADPPPRFDGKPPMHVLLRSAKSAHFPIVRRAGARTGMHLASRCGPQW